MKSHYIFLFAILCQLSSRATTWPVLVSNFQFSPATVNAVVGDTIQFNWTKGTHTTTCGSDLDGTSLPAGAAPWDSPINSNQQSFSYTITVAGMYNYGCIFHYDLGMKGTIVASGPLPVNLGAFTVSNDKNVALLQWQTFSESNVAYFSVRKSSDGVKFSEIGRVNAAGNSARELSYTFTDNDPGQFYKYLYYEIVIVDADNKESFSVIKIFRNSSITKNSLIVALSPNPIVRPGQVQVKFNADKTGQMDISIYNGAGQLMLKTALAAFYGLNSGHLHVCDLGKGIYNIVFSLDGKKESRRVVVQ